MQCDMKPHIIPYAIKMGHVIDEVHGLIRASDVVCPKHTIQHACKDESAHLSEWVSE